MKALLVSTYEMGRQPFGLASPAAWLRRNGHQVLCADLAVAPLPAGALVDPSLIAFYLPMHTATRLALPLIERARRTNPGAHLCAYGLYAPLNAELLRAAGVHSILGGEFEKDLADVAGRVAAGTATGGTRVALERLVFLEPDRTGLPDLSRYAKLAHGAGRLVTGYTEASRGCKHLCRHCPVVPVYEGRFRIVPAAIVAADIRQQAAAGARHITFGDPDFFNGPAHARRVVEQLHSEFPDLTYDITVKIEHLLAHREMLGVLRQTGCLFVTSAVESLDDAVLARLEKGHTRADFLEAVKLCRAEDLALSPTFIAFTPWTTRDSYRELLETVAALGLTAAVAPVQLALRLLITAGSRLLELPDIREIAGEFDPAALVHRWQHPDPHMDALAARALRLVGARQKQGDTRAQIFAALWELAEGRPCPENFDLMPRATVPYLDEPWYC